MKHDQTTPDDNQKRYILPMERIKLGEGVDGKDVTAPNELMIFRKGVFNHPFFGHFALTEETFRKMKENFEKNVRRIAIAGDWNHDAETAPFWLDEIVLKKKDTELWANIGWTTKGRESVESQDYRYISGEFDENYKDAETAEEFGPTLLGAALTNRPFVKGMQPLTALSESVEDFLKGKKGKDEPMTKEEQAQFDEMKTQLKELKEKESTKLSDNSEELATSKKLADDQAAEIKKLKDANTKTEEEKATVEKKATFDKMLSESKVCEAQRDPYMADDTVKFSELAQPMNTDPKGSSGDGSGEKDKTVGVTLKEGENAQDKVLELAEKMQKEDKELSDGDAIGKVLVMNPKLNEAYEKETA